LPRSLAEAVASAPADERELADLRRELDEDLEAAARSQDYQERAIAFRAIGQLRFNQKTELLRRGLDDASPAVRGSALLSLELLSRNHPGLVNSTRPRLHSLLTEDGNQAVRRLAISCLRNGSPQADTLTLLAHVANDDEDRQVAKTAAAVHRDLKLKSSARR
jgi:HEAT repeat protein